MAPRTLARSRIRHIAGWAHPAQYQSGVFSPVFFADGGDGGTAVDPEPDGDEPDSGAADWTPPTREEWETHQERLRAASGEAAARRKYLKAHGIDPKTGKKIDADELADEPAARARPDDKGDEPRGATPAEVKRAVERAAAEAEIRGLRKTKSLVTSLNDGLAVAGWNGQRLGLLMKLIDLDDVEIDDDGEVTGLAEQIEVAKREFPEAFKRTRTPAGTAKPDTGSGQNGAPAAKVDTADKPAPKAEPKGWAEQVAARALRGQA